MAERQPYLRRYRQVAGWAGTCVIVPIERGAKVDIHVDRCAAARFWCYDCVSVPALAKVVEWQPHLRRY